MSRALINAVPGVDKDGTTIFMDAFKGFEKALEAFYANVKRIICVKHRAEVIKKNLGTEDAKTALAASTSSHICQEPRCVAKGQIKIQLKN